MSGLFILVFFLHGAGEHAVVRPLSGSKLVADDERDGEMVVTYRESGSRTRKTVRGRHYSLEYETETSIGAEDIIEHFTAQAERFQGGDVHRSAGNRLTFSFRREDGGDTWCQIWATDGNYTIEIVDEAPPDNVTEPRAEDAPAAAAPTSEQVASVVFAPGSSALPGGVGAVLDDVVRLLESEPGAVLELRAHGGNAPELRATALRDALKLYGVDESRIAVKTTGEEGDRVDFFLVR